MSIASSAESLPQQDLFEQNCECIFLFDEECELPGVHWQSSSVNVEELTLKMEGNFFKSLKKEENSDADLEPT